MMKVKKLFLTVRAYSTRRNKKFVKNVKSTVKANPEIDSRLKLYQKDELATEVSACHEFENLHEDIDKFESDFMNAGKSHRMHEREREIQKEKLKSQITFSKYVKEVEPSFLTFAEKEQIKSLHESNPYEWNVEKLSESFPALPHTIRKVLHAKWSPKSVETVLRYDEKVISNWEAFRAGELPLDPTLEKHLQNFKDRQIILADREELAKRFIPPKMEFPKPKSKLFSKIAETFLLPSLEMKVISHEQITDIEISGNVEAENTDFEEQENLNDKNTNFAYKNNFDYKNSKAHKNFKEVRGLTIQEMKQTTDVVSLRQENKMILFSQDLNEGDNRKNKKRLTFDEFLEENVGRTENSSSPEDIVLKETYRRHVEKVVLFISKPASNSSTRSESEEALFNSEVTKVERNLSSTSLKEERMDSELDISTRRARENEMSSLIQNSPTYQILTSENRCPSLNFDKSGLDTYVKKCHKKDDDDVLPFIKIPKHRHKEGMTYRVKNCYYDDDGEFLYKVPGLHK